MSLLGIDVGTTGCKAAAFSADGHCLADAYREYATLRASANRAELDSRSVWRDIQDVIGRVAAATPADPITALSVSSMGEAVVPVTLDRELLDRSILSSDTRGTEYIDRLRAAMSQEEFYRINPNILGPNYSLPKLLWIQEHLPEVYARTDYFLHWADLVGFLLGCDPYTDFSLANRTLLFDIRQEQWSGPLLEWSGLDPAKLAPLKPGGAVVGHVSRAAARELGLPAGVVVVAGGHDQCCNSLGAGIHQAGSAVCGIGSFECLTPTYDRIPTDPGMLAHGLNIEHHVLPGLYVSFIYNQGGTLVKWFRDTFAAADARPQDPGRDLYAALTREMPAEPTRLLTLPYFEMTGPPKFVTDAAGVIAGLKTNTSRGEILKSIMECETLYFVDSIDAMESMGIDTSEFVATGGGAKSDAWLQIKADIFGRPFVRPRITEGSLLGAAILAGSATGVFASAREGVECFVRRDRMFEPNLERHRLYRGKLDQYRRLLPLLHDLLREL